MFRKGKHRRPTPTGRRISRRGVALGLALSLMTAGIAYADTLVVDGPDIDTVFAATGEVADFGTLCPDSSDSKTVTFKIRRSGAGSTQNPNAGTAFASPVAITVTAVPANVTATMGAGADGTVTLPPGWITSSNNTDSSDTATATIDLSSGSALGGPFQAPVTFTARGNNQATPPTVIQASATVTVRWNVALTAACDTEAPEATPTLSPAPNGAGWNNADVTVDWNWADNTGGSGINAAACTTSSTSTGEGTINLTATCTDNAGNTGNANYEVKVDKTPPSVSATASPSPNSNGWNNGQVTVSFNGTDTGSGIDGCDADIVLSSDGAGQSATGSCTDLAGNSASATATNINIDTVAPVVTPELNGTPVNSGDPVRQFTKGSEPVLTCMTNDDRSGVAIASQPSGASGPASGVGLFTATCSAATDVAGNSSEPISVTYRVVYAFDGFYRPIENGAKNVVKAGSAVPVKFSLGGYQGMSVLDGAPISQTSTSCNAADPSGGEVITETSGNSGLSYDASTDTYNYVWKTNKAWTGCRVLTVKFADGTMQTALFEFKK